MKREIFLGSVGIGGNHPVSIQSMVNRNIQDENAVLRQIRRLKKEGCQIIRLAIPDRDCLPPFAGIVKKSPLPVVADIQYDHHLALQALEMGASGIRINPGNIGDQKKLGEIIRLARQKKIPIRIGVNSGSIEKKFLSSSQSRVQSMVSSVLNKIKYFEDQDFFLLKISLKSSDILETIQAYRLIDQKCDYPLHIGITEAGTLLPGAIKSAIGIGCLLMENIGNTIRVSLTEDPLKEIHVAREILKALGKNQTGIDIISCPTCSRTSVDLIGLTKKIEKLLLRITVNKKIKVAIMGCEVNGPGEAREADIGLAFSRENGFIFRKGQPLEKIPTELAINRLIELVKEFNTRHE